MKRIVMHTDHFSVDRLARLKLVLGVAKDKEAGEALGFSEKAFHARKIRGSFPTKELRALAQQRPDLNIDVGFVLSGMRSSFRIDVDQARDQQGIRVDGPIVGALVQASRRRTGKALITVTEAQVKAIRGKDARAISAGMSHCRELMTQAFARCPPGLTGLAQALMMYDDGVFTAEQTVESMRRVLGFGKPVIPGFRELADAQAALYRGPRPGTASDSAAGA